MTRSWDLLCQRLFIFEPSLWYELFRIRSPECFRPVHCANWRRNESPLLYGNACDDFAGTGCNWCVEWYHIIFCSLKSRDLAAHNEGIIHTTRIVSLTGGWIRSTSCATESRYGSPDTSWSHVGSVPDNWVISSRSLCCFSGFLASSMSAH